MTTTRGLKSPRYIGGRQDAQHAQELESDPRESDSLRPLQHLKILSRLQSSFGGVYTSDRGGSFGRHTDDRMHDEHGRRTETNRDVHEPLSSREYVQCTFECAMHIDSTRDSFSGGGGL